MFKSIDYTANLAIAALDKDKVIIYQHNFSSENLSRYNQSTSRFICFFL
ncbi:hypothetical protein AB3R30_14100 [Leptolyngbyaceae cyanobacterium UHCC 1019]